MPQGYFWPEMKFYFELFSLNLVNGKHKPSNPIRDSHQSPGRLTSHLGAGKRIVVIIGHFFFPKLILFFKNISIRKTERQRQIFHLPIYSPNIHTILLRVPVMCGDLSSDLMMIMGPCPQTGPKTWDLDHASQGRFKFIALLFSL